MLLQIKSITNCTFSNNSSSDIETTGGAINSNSSELEITGSTFSNNYISIVGITAFFSYGGAVFHGNGDMKIENTIFNDNQAIGPGSGAQGGALYLSDTDGFTFSVTNCTFLNNSADFAGGGIAFSGVAPNSAYVSNCTFFNNTATNSGGAIANTQGSPIVSNCTFFNNTATNSGAIQSNQQGSPIITNCILWNNGTEIATVNSTPVVTYSIVEGGYAGTGNIDADPLFVDAANGDYSLDDCSPAINTGDGVAGSSANTTTTDLAGNARFFNSTVIDMGAYESQGGSCCTASSPLPTTAGLYTGAIKATDSNGWTHYCTNGGELLLSLEETGTGIDLPASGVSLQIADPMVQTLTSGTGFITNPDGVVVINRTWDVNPTTAPTADVPVRNYFTAAEYAAINTALGNQSQTQLTAPSEMWFYKATSGAAHDAIANIPTAIVLTNGTASTTEWALGTHTDGHYAEYHVTSFSGGGGGGANAGASALPVEMLYFSCSEAGKNVQLNWATASELNNQGFEIERSTDAQSFTNIGWVAGRGTTSEQQNYAFVDNDVATNTQYYYRLKQLDFDGRFEYSEIKSIMLKSGASTPILIYPNPVKGDVLTIQLDTDIESDIQIQFFDLTGK